MDFLASQLKQIRARLSGSSPSQWVSIALFTIVLAIAFVWMMNWAGQGEWTPLLDQTLSADEMQRVRAELATAGVDTRVEGDRIKIKGGDASRQQWQALLAERGALPRDISLSYSAIVKNSNPFTGESAAKWIQSRGLETELSGVLSRFRGIKEARVLITMPPSRGFGRQGASSASVNVVMKGEESLDKGRVNAIANFVAGAVTGLKPADVKITDGSKFYRAADGDSSPTAILDIQKQNEEHAAQKIYDQLRNIKGVVVNVHAELRTAEEEKSNRELGAPAPSKETTKSDEMVNSANSGATGVRPNEGRSLTDGGSGSSSTKEETTTEYASDRNTKETRTKEMLGAVERLTASISIPFSYLENVYRKEKAIAAGTAVKVSEIDPVATIQIAKIRALVKPLISAKDENQVAVDWYFDGESTEGAAAAAAATQSAEAGMAPMLKEYGPKAGLGFLALLSLFGVLRLARRSPDMLGLPSMGPDGKVSRARRGRRGEEDEKELETFSGPLAVGEAHEMAGVLEGREVDETVVRTQQIVKQIADMVKEDPRAAAGLVERWARKD